MSAMHGISPFEQTMIYVVLATAFIALGYAYWLARQTFAADKGSEAMQRIWGSSGMALMRIYVHSYAPSSF